MAADEIVCTVPTGAINSCDGDSGGPVLVYRDERLVDVAMTMAGWGCGPEARGLNIRLNTVLSGGTAPSNN
ncbi:MAG: trypsin-like serine protease [Actinomycetota bacterium]|nr:trypsin-like serine protease [Actinomycetota bacterium]